MLKLYVFTGLFASSVIYSMIVYTSGTKGGPVMMSEEAKQGKLLFQKYNCTSCHQLYGLGGYLGPELTTTISRRGKGYAKAFLTAGSRQMPDFHLNEEEQNDIVEFLAYVDSTAITYKTKN